MFLGSTADHVIRHAKAPCLVLRGELPLPVRRVAVPVDLAETTAGTLDVALAWTDALGRNAGRTGAAGVACRGLSRPDAGTPG